MIPIDAVQQLRESIMVNGKRFRIHTGIILTFSFLCALAGSIALMNFGISELWIRYGLVCVIGYLVFLLVYLLWYRHIRHELQTELLVPSAKVRRTLHSKYEKSRVGKKSNPVVDFFVELFLNILVDELAIAIGFLIIVLALVVVLVVSPYIVLDLLLAEAVLLIAARRTSQFSADEALWKIALSTIWIFLALLVAIEAWAILLSWMYPGADSIGQVIKMALHR